MEKTDLTEFSPADEKADLATNEKVHNENFTIQRPVYSQHDFDLDYQAKDVRITLTSKMKNIPSNLKEKYCTKEELENMFHRRFPFILILWRYKWRRWIVEDLIAGIIVGIMNIVQGMAYAQLAGLSPVYGLYVSIIPPLIYFFFGTSKHISIGTMAIASLMTGKFLEKSLVEFPLTTFHNITQNTTITYIPNANVLMAQRTAGFALLVGVIQVLMWVLNIGILMRYLSDPVISGFTVGASLHVFTCQLPYGFGVDTPSFYGLFNIVKTIFAIILRIPETNIPTFVLTMICIVLLLITKIFINPFLMRKIKLPFPMELLLIICGIVVSDALSLKEKHHVAIVGEIAHGLPAPYVPDLKHTHNYVADLLKTAIIAFTVSVSLADMFSKKHDYTIHSNQELLAYGIVNVCSSFFLCFPSAASLSRSAVQESVGGKTQITSIISSCLVLSVLLVIGPLFEHLPKCILASIILVSLRDLIMQLKELREMWIFSFWDFIIWLLTFLGTVILDVEYGLLIGISLSIILNMVRTQSPKSQILGQIPGTDIYRDISTYPQCIEFPGIKIFRYEGSLYYASCEHFKTSIYSKVNCDPKQIYSQIVKLEKKLQKVEHCLESDTEETDLLNSQKHIKIQLEEIKNLNLCYIIIDCSTCEYIDIVGQKTINQIIEEFQKINISVLLAGPKSDVRQMFYKTEARNKIDDKNIYLTVHDAAISCLSREKSVEEK